MTETLTLKLQRVRELRYGENPHQKAAIYEDAALFRFPLSILQGKELSYTNFLDLDSAWKTVNLFEKPAAVIVKHTNACGAALGSDSVEAYVRARDADALSAFGGIVALNRPLDERTAIEIASTFVECVIAPEVSAAALLVLANKPALRVVTGAQKSFGLDLRSVFGCLLAQEPDLVSEAVNPWPLIESEASVLFTKVVTKREPTARQWEALRFAWRVCAGIKSNAVIFTDDVKTLALGCGQTSRVDAVDVATLKAGRLGISLLGSVAASDAFFPFRDGLDAVANAGAVAVVQPGGSKRDEEVITAADEHNMAMVFTGCRHFRH